MNVPHPSLRFLIRAVPLAALLTLSGVQVQADSELYIDLKEGMSTFPSISNAWGTENVSILTDVDGGISRSIMRIFVPKGAIDPMSMKNQGLPFGGTGFKSKVFPSGVARATLSYRVRFPEEFDFVRGGKLPGLYGGKGNSGGRIPDGTDGFSFRLMWGKNGFGSVYAYLPSSVKYGSGFLIHKLRFQPGQWHLIQQELILNTPGQADGKVRMWQDGRFLGEAGSLVIRTVDGLRINGVFFDVFFGGDDPTWAATADTHIDFADFVLRSIDQ